MCGSNHFYCGIDLEIHLLKSLLLAKNYTHVLIFTCFEFEGACIHWASREHSTSTEPTLGDSETVVYAFLQSIKCVLLMISIQLALINIGPTRPPVVDVVLLCVAGGHPCQMY